jgi:hypothetical protein
MANKIRPRYQIVYTLLDGTPQVEVGGESSVARSRGWRHEGMCHRSVKGIRNNNDNRGIGRMARQKEGTTRKQSMRVPRDLYFQVETHPVKVRVVGHEARNTVGTA